MPQGYFWLLSFLLQPSHTSLFLLHPHSTNFHHPLSSPRLWSPLPHVICGTWQEQGQVRERGTIGKDAEFYGEELRLVLQQRSENCDPWTKSGPSYIFIKFYWNTANPICFHSSYGYPCATVTGFRVVTDTLWSGKPKIFTNLVLKRNIFLSHKIELSSSNQSLCKDSYAHVHSSTSYNSQIVEPAQMSIQGCTDTQIVAYTYKGVLLCHRKKSSTDGYMLYNTRELQTRYAK